MHTTTVISPAPSHAPLLGVVRTAIRFTTAFALPGVLGIATGLALTITVPMFFGGQALTVMSGSMEPLIQTGAVVITERIAPLDARVGDIVTFSSPERAKLLLTHRVRHVRAKGGHVYFVTKGDAVNTVERWSVPMNGRIGRTTFRIQKLGYALYWMNSPFGRAALFLLPVLMALGYGLSRIWSSDDKASPDAPRAKRSPLPAPARGAAPPIRETPVAEKTSALLTEVPQPAERAALETVREATPSLRATVPQVQSTPARDDARGRRGQLSLLLVSALLLAAGYTLVRGRSAWNRRPS
jgi:signal peptidase